MANDKWSGSNPWLGLAPYTEGTPLYGRTKESIQLADIIKDYTASVVFGKSGIGKSSLLSAGISPLLREENYIPVRIRLVHNTEVSYIEQIESKVRETVKCIDRLPPDVSNLGLWDFFHRNTFTMENGIDCIPVIILDQFEEIYTLTDADHKKDIVAFFNELSSLLNDTKPDNVIEEEQKHSVIHNDSALVTPRRGIIKRSAASTINYTSATTFRFVICLREDKLYLLERNSANIPSLKTNRYNLQALSPDSALEVIMCPRPELFSNEEATAIIDKLADMGDEGIQTIDPAILSLFLYKYYEKQGQANYDNIFADYYQEATKDIKGKSIAFLEDHLLTLGGYRNQVPLDDALSSGVSQTEIDSLLKQIILRTEKRKGVDYIEFSHDRLCVEAKKSREERAVREQARKVRRRYLLSILIFCISAVMLSVVLVLFLKWKSSEEGRLSAEERQLTAEARTREEKRQKEALALLNEENQRQKDSLAILNEKNLDQKVEIEHQRDELQAKNIELSAKLATIEEQKHIIEELQFGSREELKIANKEAGRLYEALPYSALRNAISLTISGDLNGVDIKYLNDNISNKLKYLNLADVNTSNDVFIGKEYIYNASSLETIVLPSNVKSIGDFAFKDMSRLKRIILPENATSIGERAFQGCTDLLSITIPNGVETIKPYTFYDCSNLSSIVVPNSVKSIKSAAFGKCGHLKSIIIPNGIDTIHQSTFSGCVRLSSVEIPQSVKVIDSFAFHACSNLQEITIPDNVISIGTEAFSECVNLTTIRIPRCLTEIGKYVFAGSGLSYILVDKENKTFDSRENCNAVIKTSTNELIFGCKNSTIPKTVTHIGAYAFYESRLTSIVIPPNVTSIGEYAFSRSPLDSITIENSLKTIRDNTFRECRRLKYIHIPSSVESIGSSAFEGCSNLKSIYISEGVERIETSAFQKCTTLQSVAIPKSVKTIGNYAFSECSNLISITFQKGISTIGRSAFERCYKLSSISIPNGIENIERETFKWCESLESVTISEGVKTIGESAFKGCKNLVKITIPDQSVKFIEKNAFENCVKLSSINLPEGLTKIEVHAFSGCSSLSSIKIAKDVGSIDAQVFEDCNLSSIIVDKENKTFDSRDNSNAIIKTSTNELVLGSNNTTIPKTVTSIGKYAFSSSNLKTINIPRSITSIDEGAFRLCDSLVSVDIPNSVNDIGIFAFNSCYKLEKLTIHNNVRSIERAAFAYCRSLTRIDCYIQNLKSVHLGQFVFSNIPKNCTWHVLRGKVQDYKSQTWWLSTWNIVDDL